MNRYSNPEIEIIKFSMLDVILASGAAMTQPTDEDGDPNSHLYPPPP